MSDAQKLIQHLQTYTDLRSIIDVIETECSYTMQCHFSYGTIHVMGYLNDKSVIGVYQSFDTTLPREFREYCFSVDNLKHLALQLAPHLLIETEIVEGEYCPINDLHQEYFEVKKNGQIIERNPLHIMA